MNNYKLIVIDIEVRLSHYKGMILQQIAQDVTRINEKRPHRTDAIFFGSQSG